jgi:hypothetical protein
MKRLLLAGSALLLVLLFLHWNEVDSLQTQLEQSLHDLQTNRTELEGVRSQLAEKSQQLEAAKASLEATQAQLAQADASRSNPAAAGRSSTEISGSDGTSGNSAFVKNLIALAEKASDLDRRFKAFPELDIPEVALLSESDWISVVSEHPKLETADDIRRALEAITNKAKSKAIGHLRSAVSMAGHTRQGSAPPESLDALMPTLRQKLTEPMLQRYELLPMARVEQSWLDQPSVQRNLKEQAEKGNPPTLVLREKDAVAGTQQVILFFSGNNPSSISFPIMTSTSSKRP